MIDDYRAVVRSMPSRHYPAAVIFHAPHCIENGNGLAVTVRGATEAHPNYRFDTCFSGLIPPHLANDPENSRASCRTSPSRSSRIDNTPIRLLIPATRACRSRRTRSARCVASAGAPINRSSEHPRLPIAQRSALISRPSTKPSKQFTPDQSGGEQT